ncbi:myosin motor domain [Chrysochromulina tobinii]|uniref:Myosin motor domain n=1 Tax=Chrysochromulina tobinii TaxID=1460289 RepID=A0A0M0K4B8_9EUKA|nr:myosin motor domain [Chrysochromulina tobinii]|eukprot:KOO33649.1 myosin motor domain [Chrysochromulina sp. CCMP291]
MATEGSTEPNTPRLEKPSPITAGPGASELTSLKSVEDAAILANTRDRYESGHIYTRSGRLLLAVNPYRALPLYTPEVLELYKHSLQPQIELPPHVFAVASSAHLGMMQDMQSQSVIISGESGAGKTETAKILLMYLAAVSSSGGGDLHERVLQTNPIMENFGNARTVWNNNSSRFGKFLTLQFSVSGRMQGAKMDTYLLEKSRITSQLPDEQNYHVMYLVAANLPEAKRREYGMDSWETFAYLNVRDKRRVEWDQFPSTWDQLQAAMNTIPTVTQHTDGVWKVIAAILHLGNAKFKGTGDDDAIFVDGGAIAHAAKLLGCVTDQLTKAICTLNIKAGLDWIAKPNTTRYSQSSKDALAKALYSRVFDRLVERINESLIFGGESRYFIGAVDIFGFECFPRNSLEQLCINFANEKLQRMFTETVFESVIAEYKREGIDVRDITFEDNTEVVKLVEDSPSGLLTLLSEECFFPNGSDEGWLLKIKQAHGNVKKPHPNFDGNVKESKTSFTVIHYPGKVTYDAIGFLEKNKDPLSQDVKVLMQYSDDEFVAGLFADKPGPGGKMIFKSAKFTGVIDSFRKSLNDLVSTLKQTKTHFIRCVKPNEKKQPNLFVDDVMKRQLYTSGVVQAVRATRQGFPDHLLFDELVGRFALIVDKDALVRCFGSEAQRQRLAELRMKADKGSISPSDEQELKRAVAGVQERAKPAVTSMLEKAKVPDVKYRLGKTKVFLGLSFERKTAKKKREEAEKKKADEEAAAAAAAAAAAPSAPVSAPSAARTASLENVTLEERRSSLESDVGLIAMSGDTFAGKLQNFQQDVADGTVADSDMMNVAVVSDIGWKTGQEPSSEDVWAQYDFKCAVSDVLEYAEYLGMDIKEDAHLLWIADEALQAPEPQGWEQRLDPKGGVYYYHPTTGMSLNQHPLDHHYQQFYMQMKAQYDAMYQSNKGKNQQMAAATALPISPPPEAAPEAAPESSPDTTPKKKKSMFGLLGLGGSKKPPGPTEEMFQLTVDLLRQQDGLGIGLTLDNIIVEVEPGGSVAAQGDLRYGDQIVQVDGIPLQGRMLKDVIVPRKMHQLVVRYTRVSTQPTSPRRVRSKRIELDPGSAPRRIEELDVVITREASSNRLGFGIDQMNTVVEVDPNGPVASKLQVGDKIIAVDGELLNFRKFVEVVSPNPSIKLRIARLRAANVPASGTKSKKEQLFGQSKAKKKKAAQAAAQAAVDQAIAGQSSSQLARQKPRAAMPALREVKLVKESEETKIGAVFHRLDDAFDKSFFNVEGSSVQPIIKKVDPGSMAEMAGLVPGDIVLSVNGVSGLSNFQVVEMLRKGQGVFTLVVISGRQVQSSLVAQNTQPQQQQPVPAAAAR